MVIASRKCFVKAELVFGQIAVTMRSMATRNCNTMVLDISEQQLVDFLDGTEPLVEEAFPELSQQEKEFLRTGITPMEWDSISNYIKSFGQIPEINNLK